MGSSSAREAYLPMLPDPGRSGIWLLLWFERHNCVGGSGVAHEAADIRFEVALFIGRICQPASVGRLLIMAEPFLRAGYSVFRGGRVGFAQNIGDEASRVAVALRFERSVVLALPVADKGAEAEAAVFRLLRNGVPDDGVTLGGCQEARNARRCPDHHDPVDGLLRWILANEPG